MNFSFTVNGTFVILFVVFVICPLWATAVWMGLQALMRRFVPHLAHDRDHHDDRA